MLPVGQRDFFINLQLKFNIYQTKNALQSSNMVLGLVGGGGHSREGGGEHPGGGGNLPGVPPPPRYAPVHISATLSKAASFFSALIF